MANSCFTRYAFYGNIEDLLELYDKLKSIDSKMGYTSVLTGSGYLPLGYIWESLGGDITNMHYNGFVESMEMRDDDSHHPYIMILTDTDCVERNEVWDFILKSHPSVKYYYIASEIGEEYYVTNDANGVYFPGRYVLAQDDRDTELYETEEALLEELSSRLDVKLTSIGEINNALVRFEGTNKNHGNIRVEIYKVTTNEKH